MVRKSTQAKKVAVEYTNYLESLGWFAGFPPEAKEMTLKNVEKDQNSRPDLYLLGLIVDLESANYEGVHREIVLELSRSSFGLFKPESVAEKWVDLPDGTLIEVSIAIGGKEYAHEWMARGHYIDENFDYLVREVIERVNPKLTLGTIWLNEQQILYLVCNKEAYLKGLNQGLFLSSYQDTNFSGEALTNLLNRFQNKKSLLRLQAGLLLRLWFDFGWFDFECAKAFQSALKDRNKAIKTLATSFIEKYGQAIEDNQQGQTTGNKRVRFMPEDGYSRFKDSKILKLRMQTAKEYLSQLESVGWFEALPKAIKEITEEEIIDDDYNRPDLCLPGVYQYLDCVEGPGTYKVLVEELVKTYERVFLPDKIDEKWTKSKQVTLTIKVKGNKYSRSWKQEDELIDNNFEELLKEAIENTNPKLTLGVIWPGDDSKLYIICNKSAYQKALDKGLMLSLSNDKLELSTSAIENLKNIFSNSKSLLRLFAAELLTLWLQNNNYQDDDLDDFRDAFTDVDENIRRVARKLVTRFGKVYTL